MWPQALGSVWTMGRSRTSDRTTDLRCLFAGRTTQKVYGSSGSLAADRASPRSISQCGLVRSAGLLEGLTRNRNTTVAESKKRIAINPIWISTLENFVRFFVLVGRHGPATFRKVPCV